MMMPASGAVASLATLHTLIMAFITYSFSEDSLYTSTIQRNQFERMKKQCRLRFLSSGSITCWKTPKSALIRGLREGFKCSAVYRGAPYNKMNNVKDIK